MSQLKPASWQTIGWWSLAKHSQRLMSPSLPDSRLPNAPPRDPPLPLCFCSSCIFFPALGAEKPALEIWIWIFTSGPDTRLWSLVAKYLQTVPGLKWVTQTQGQGGEAPSHEGRNFRWGWGWKAEREILWRGLWNLILECSKHSKIQHPPPTPPPAAS